MILLIGGTSETAPLASGLAAAGYEVLVSTATNAPLAIGDHPRISRREGRLNEEGMVALAGEKGIRVIVDAAHPYAAEAHTVAGKAARRLGIPCLVFRRAAADMKGENIRFAADHAEAAEMAFAFGRPVLLTTPGTSPPTQRPPAGPASRASSASSTPGNRWMPAGRRESRKT
jgi:precorrin-6A/cobalt-precorrin-6A reductase